MGIDEIKTEDQVKLKVSDDESESAGLPVPIPAAAESIQATSSGGSSYREWKKTQKEKSGSTARLTPKVFLFLIFGSVFLGMGGCGVAIMMQCAFVPGANHHYGPAELFVAFVCLVVALIGVGMIGRGLMSFNQRSKTHQGSIPIE